MQERVASRSSSGPLLGFTVAGFLVLLSSASHGAFVFDGRLDGGSFSSYRAMETNGLLVSGVSSPNGMSDRISKVVDPLHPGRDVAKLSIFHGDALNWGGLRSELSGYEEPLNIERWYSFGYMLGADWMQLEPVVKIFQIHDKADAGESGLRHPTLQITSFADGTIQIWNARDADLITTPPDVAPRPNFDYDFRKLAQWNAAPGTWNSIVINASWTHTDGGFLRIWHNDELVFSEVGSGNTFNDLRGPWFKAGTYALARADGWSSLTTYNTGVVIGDGFESFDSMRQAVAAPVPEPASILTLLLGGGLVFSWTRRSRG